jgi:hypothetical protein
MNARLQASGLLLWRKEIDMDFKVIQGCFQETFFFSYKQFSLQSALWERGGTGGLLKGKVATVLN